MIESLLEDLPQNDGCDEHKANRTPGEAAAPPEDPFLATLPVVHRIVSRRRSWLDVASRSDLFQEVALRLWRWRRKHDEKSGRMSDDEWRAFAARTAYNEVSRSFSRERAPIANVDPDDVPAIETATIEGQTEIEVFSLVRSVWQGICTLSLRQRRALLLHSQELIIYFLQTGITEEQLAETLDFREKDWNDICDRLPLTDAEIAERTEGTAGSIKKARYEARVKLEGSIRK